MTSLAERVVETLQGGDDFNHREERLLQQGIHDRLAAAGYVVRPEAWLSDTDRIDFLVHHPDDASDVLGIECKVGGATSALRRQVHRYAQHDEIHALLVATTQFKHRDLPAFAGDPLAPMAVHVLVLGGWG